MVNFIKNRLRLVLENVITEIKYSKPSELIKTQKIIDQLTKKYENDEYFLNVNDGQWVGDVFAKTNGHLNVQRSDKPAGEIRSSSDIVKEKSSGIRFIAISAGRGIEHPNTFSDKESPALTRGGAFGGVEYETIDVDGDMVEIPKAGSPASDAVIKAYINYPTEIISLIKKNMKGYSPYVDDKEGAQARIDDFGDAETQEKAGEKFEKQTTLDVNKPLIVARDDYEMELINLTQQFARDRRKGNLSKPQTEFLKRSKGHLNIIKVLKGIIKNGALTQERKEKRVKEMMMNNPWLKSPNIKLAFLSTFIK